MTGNVFLGESNSVSDCIHEFPKPRFRKLFYSGMKNGVKILKYKFSERLNASFQFQLIEIFKLLSDMLLIEECQGIIGIDSAFFLDLV